MRSLVVDAEPWFFARLRADKLVGLDSTLASTFPQAFLDLAQHGPFEQVFLGALASGGEVPQPGQSALDVAVVLAAMHWRPMVVVIHHPEDNQAASIQALLARRGIRCMRVPASEFTARGPVAYHDALAELETS